MAACKRTKPGGFELVSPTNGATNVSLSPTLQWSDAKDELSYSVVLSKDAGFTQVVAETALGQGATTYAVPVQLENFKTYYWKIEAKNRGGRNLADNAPFSFTTAPISAFTLGGASTDWIDNFEPTPDGGFILGAYTQNFGTSGGDGWLIKLNAGLQTQWEIAYGMAGYEEFLTVLPTADGGYLAAGTTNSVGAGSDDLWLLKVDSSGAVQWQKAMGGSNSESYAWPRCAARTTDNRYAVMASASSFGAGDSDIWVIMLQQDGTVDWQKTYGGTVYETPYAIAATSDGGVIVAATTYIPATQTDMYLLKLDSTGAIQWEKAYGSSSTETPQSVVEVPGGGYLVSGVTYSYGTGGEAIVLRLDNNGNVIWEYSYGGSQVDNPYSIVPLADGSLISAETRSFGAGLADFWIFRLDNSGTILWQKAYGGTGNSNWPFIAPYGTGYAVAGTTTTFGAGSYDVWFLTLESTGSVGFNPSSGATVTDTVATVTPTAVTVTNMSAAVQNTNATVTITNATVTVTNATKSLQ